MSTGVLIDCQKEGKRKLSYKDYLDFRDILGKTQIKTEHLSAEIHANLNLTHEKNAHRDMF